MNPPPPPPPPPSRAAAGTAQSAGAAEARLTLRVTRVALSSGGSVRLTRRVVLSVGSDAVLERATGKSIRWSKLAPGTRVRVTTTPLQPTLAAQRARPGVLHTARVLVR